jgi:hypothetical protein
MNKLEWDEWFWYCCRSWLEITTEQQQRCRYLSNLASSTDQRKKHRVMEAGRLVFVEGRS